MSTENAPEIEIKQKQKFTGTIKKITMAGAVIDIGQDKPGVLHISQIQKDSVNKIEDVLKEEQSVEVWVRRVRSDRIELSMIEPLGLDWKDIKPEMVVKGKVVRLETYGAFVDFGAERPGMIHVSELAHGFVKSPGDVVKDGDEIEAMVLEVDRRKKQIKLSIKALLPQPEEKMEDSRSARPERSGGKGKRSGGKPAKFEYSSEDDDNLTKTPDLTVFEIAWQAALERQQDKRGKGSKKAKAGENSEQEDIISRTLEKRLNTGN